jgi:hypothetical protein
MQIKIDYILLSIIYHGLNAFSLFSVFSGVPVVPAPVS